MNNSHKICSLLLLFILLALLTGCSQPDVPLESQEPEPASSGEQHTSPVKIGSLLGPTGMGMVKLINDAAQNKAALDYDFSLAGSPDDLVAKIINREVDIAALPTNLALVLYNKTGGQIQLAAVNTLGVLYLLEQNNDIHSVADLKGKEISLSGKGSTPDFVLQYLLKEHGLLPGEDVQLNYFTQHSDLAAALAEGDVEIGLLPQPHVTTAQIKGNNLRIALDITEEWAEVTGGLQLPMGCIIVQKDFAAENPGVLETFLSEYEKSVTFVNNNSEPAAQLIEEHKILPSAAVAQKALPFCNIVYIDAGEARSYLEEYYQILYDFEPASVGGKLADEDFYYCQN